MKQLLTFFFVAACVVSRGQNLVPNPSFEDTIACPQEISKIENARFWFNCGGTPDYFNACNPDTNSSFLNDASVPENWIGFQYAATGNAYAGILSSIIYPGTGSDKEYIGCGLLDTLVVGTKYFFSFKVSNASRIIFSDASVECFSNNIGLRFSTNAYSQAQPAPLDNFSHFHSNIILNDTANWILLKGEFIADSTYTYLIIGNFYTDENTLFYCDSTLMYSYVGYYIDDVCVAQDSITCYGITGLENFNQNSLPKIYPNPAKDWIQIEGSDITSITLTDIFGKVHSNKLIDISYSRLQINVSSLSRGFYLLTVNSGNQTLCKKIILN